MRCRRGALICRRTSTVADRSLVAPELLLSEVEASACEQRGEVGAESERVAMTVIADGADHPFLPASMRSSAAKAGDSSSPDAQPREGSASKDNPGARISSASFERGTRVAVEHRGCGNLISPFQEDTSRSGEELSGAQPRNCSLFPPSYVF